MESEVAAARRHFDLTMSRRTRRAFEAVKHSDDQNHSRSSPLKEGSASDKPDTGGGREEREEGGNDRKSLNQLISGRVGSERKEKISSLSQHFKEEEKQQQQQPQQQQLQLVSKQNGKLGENGMKLKGMVGRYAKVLSNLMKANKQAARISSRKKPLTRLKM